ncbi:MAG: four helix bundle protein [Xanthomonadales bacterium]|nr:four helix bundle protein [Xanthomonadales bacterium]
MVESYRDLVAWRNAMEIVEAVYAATSRFPADEKFGLVSQLRRAAVSIPSALAEGHERASTREYSHYVSIAKGSLAEVETQVLIAQRLGYMESTTVDRLLSRCDEQGRLLRGLRKSLDNKLAATSPGRALAPRPSPR